MSGEPEYRFEFFDEDVVVLDSGASVVHRLTGEAADAVREARDEVSRRRAIKMAIATGVGVVTMALPSAAAATSGGGGGVGGQGGSDPNVLDAPANLTVTATGNQSVSLSWDAVTGATSYQVSYKKTTDLSYSSTAATPNTSGTVTGLVNGTEYQFTVTASAVGKTPGTTSPVTATPTAPEAPGAPTSVGASLSGTTATVSWSAPTSGGAVDSYTLEWRLSDSASYTTVSTSAVSPVEVSGLTKGKTYIFRVTAVNVTGTAAASSSGTYVPNPPAAPNNFVATPGSGAGQSVLSWEENTSAGTPTSYTIQWKLTSSASYADADILTGVTGTTYTKSGLTPGATYDFRIKAVNADGASGWVSDDSYVKNPPNAPTSAAAVVTGTTASVTWVAPIGGGSVTSYTVERKLSSESDANYGSLSTNATSPYSATGLTKGATYVFRVTAVNSDGSASATTSNTYVPDPPGAPTVSATVSGTSATVTWSAGTGATPTSYKLEYRIAGDSDTDASYTLVTSGATSPYTVDYLTPGSSYVFRVTSVHADGTASGVSSSKSIANPPGNPLSVTATGSNAQVVLAWSAPVSGGTVSSYTVVHGIVGGSMTTVTGITAATTSRTFSSLTNGSTYQYTITAVNSDGSSSGVTVYAIPYTTNQTTASAASSVGPISTLTTSPTAASLTVDSDGTNYEYELDGASAVSVLAGSTTSLALSAATHTVVVRKTLNGAEVEATAVMTAVTKTASTSVTTTLYIPNSVNGVRTISTTLIGGTGGAGGRDTVNKSGGSPGQPGKVTGTFTVAAGDNLQYAAGTGGGTGSGDVANSGAGSAGANPMSGYDGGIGGKAGSSGASGSGGGGGGATVLIRTGASNATVVAAGSGGGGGAGGDGNGGNGDTYSAVSGNGTSGGAGTDFGSGDGGGGGGGGGGAIGGAGGTNSNTGTESYGLGGRSGSNSNGSIGTLTASTNSGSATGDNGSLTMSYYEVTSITGTTVGQISESSLGASTPTVGIAPSTSASMSALSGNAAVLTSWTAVSGATDYLVYYRRNGTSTWGLAGTSATTSLGVKGLRNGTKYDFAVRARTGSNVGALSSTASATPSASVTNSPVSAATCTTTLVTVTLDNLNGCTYTSKLDSAAAVSVTGQSTTTGALSGSSHTLVVTKDYYDGSASATITKTVTLTRTTTSSSANSSSSFTVPTVGPREMSTSLIGGKGGKGGDDGGSTGFNGGDPGEVAGVFSVEDGDLVLVYAGSGGSAGTSSANGAAGGARGSNSYAGYDGGIGGAAGTKTSTSSGGGGGGGAASATIISRNDTPIVVAVAAGSGGGGGAGQSGGSAGQGHTANGSSTSGSNGGDRGNYDGGGGGGGGGGAVGGTGGTANSDTNDKGGNGGARGTNSVTGLTSTTTNSTKSGLSNGANGTATITYYTVGVA